MEVIFEMKTRELDLVLHSPGGSPEATEVVDALEADHNFQEKVLSVFHAAMHTFAGNPAVKIIENNLGRAYIKMQQHILIPKQPPPPPA